MTDPVVLTLTVGDWQTIDATMDNTAQSLQVGDSEAAWKSKDSAQFVANELKGEATARSIREQGWQQVTTWPGGDAAYPDSAAECDVSLTAAEWLFIVGEIELSNVRLETFLSSGSAYSLSVQAEWREGINITARIAKVIREGIESGYYS